MAASYYGLAPFRYPIEQRSDLFAHKACHDLVSRITDKKHLYTRFCRAVLSDTYKAQPVAARVFEENLFFWLTMQYCLESLRQRPDHDTILRTQNLRMAEEVAQRVRGRALVLLDSGNFVMCTGAVDIGDVVVLSNSFRDTLLLRPDCLACCREDGACDGHGSIAEVWDGFVSRQTHLLVDHPYVNGLRGQTSYDAVFAKEVCARDELIVVLG
ncbi:hypothetical protein MN608_09186 [Microdochium nivale]|nr:hypothetical protein MN608_09186 [Microdochium nivale]